MHPDKIKEYLLKTGEYLTKNSPLGYYAGFMTMIAGLPHESQESLKESQSWLFDNWPDKYFFIPLGLTHPDKLDKQNEFLRKSPDLRFCHTGENWIRNDKAVSPPAYLDKSNHYILEKSLHRCIICPSSVVMHKNIFSEVGYFDESMPVCEDYDLWLRILVQYNIGLLDQKLVTKFGGHSDQLSKAYWGMDRFRVQTLQKLLNHSILTSSQKSSVLRVLIEKLEILAKGFTNRKKLCEAEKFIDLKASLIQQLQSVAQG